MKYISQSILITCLLIACSKSDLIKANSPLINKWDWFQTRGMIGTSTPQSTGKEWQITFYTDSTFIQSGMYGYEIFHDSGGKYSLFQGTLGNAWSYGTFINLSSPSVSPRYFKYYFQSPDTLLLDSGSPYDAPVFYFVRNK